MALIMIRFTKYLSILAILVLPIFAHASSPYTDNFENYNAEGWTTAPAGATCNVLPDATTTSYSGSRGTVMGYHTSGPCAPFAAQVSFVHTGTDQVGSGDMEWRVKMVNIIPSAGVTLAFCNTGTGSGSCTTASTIGPGFTISSNNLGDENWHKVDILYSQTSLSTTTFKLYLDDTLYSTFDRAGTYTAHGVYAYSNGNAFNTGNNSFIYLDDLTDFGGGGSQGTVISTVTPYSYQVVGTSTSFGFGATGFVTPGDYRSGMQLHLHYTNGGFASTIAVGPAFADLQQQDSSGDFYFDITSPGYFSFSTTTPITTVGDYTMDTSIEKPLFSFFGFDFTIIKTTVTATTTFFTVATSTAFGTLRTSVIQDYQNFMGQASSTINTSVCNPISGNFSILPCMSILFVPQPTQIQSTVATLKAGILSKLPWGYATRLIVILSGQASTSLPVVTVNIQTSSSTATQLPYTFNPGEMIAGAAGVLDSTRDPVDNKNWRDVFGPYVQLLVALFVVIIIWHDVMAMGHSSHGPRDRTGKST